MGREQRSKNSAQLGGGGLGMGMGMGMGEEGTRKEEAACFNTLLTSLCFFFSFLFFSIAFYYKIKIKK